MAKQTKAFKARTGDTLALISFSDAIKAVKENAKAKFDESIEIAVNLGVDPRHADQQVRGVVNLPSGTGRDVRVAVFAKDAKADEARAAGAEYVGAEDLYEQINGCGLRHPRDGGRPDRQHRQHQRLDRDGGHRRGGHARRGADPDRMGDDPVRADPRRRRRAASASTHYPTPAAVTLKATATAVAA